VIVSSCQSLGGLILYLVRTRSEEDRQAMAAVKAQRELEEVEVKLCGIDTYPDPDANANKTLTTGKNGRSSGRYG